VQLGSNNLNPEKIVSVDLGYQGWFFKHRLRLRGDVFFNHITDLIGSTRISTTPSVLGFANNGVADINGFEAGIEYLATSWLSGFVNYSYEKIGQHFDNPDLLRGAPRDKVNAGLRADWANGLRGEVSFNYVSSAAYPVSSVFSQFSRPPFNGPLPQSNNVGSYSLLNLYLAYAFWKDRAEVAFSVFNALNDVHKEFPLGDEIGSRAMGWLTIKM
jgi:iron complex outermembrane receptor protein